MEEQELPDEQRIGRTFDWEVDDATDDTLQDSGMPETVPSSESFKFDRARWREGSLQRETLDGEAGVDHRRRQNDGY